MSLRVFIDTVTLRHFGAVGRLDIIQYVFSSTAAPRWTFEAREEVRRHRGEVGCNAVLESAAGWLGAPEEPETEDLVPIQRILTGLAEGRINPKDAGEAEAIHFAEKHEAEFVTDDGAAYAFAARRLGTHRVHDTVHILRTAVAEGHLTAGAASSLCLAMERQQRYLRRVHRGRLGDARYFA